MQLNLFGFENTKKCCTCKKVLPICEFYLKNDKRCKIKTLHTVCKICSNRISKKWRKKNNEKHRLYNKLYYQKNKGKIDQMNRKWYKENKEKSSLRNKEWRKNNKEKIKSNWRTKYYNDNLFRIKSNIRHLIYASFKNKNLKKNTKTANILCADWDTFKKHIENQFTDNMSWDNFDKIHIDHKIPLASASTEFEVIALNHYTNLQPLWAEDNLSKSDKYDPEDFKKYMDWYTKNIKPYPEK